MSENKVLLNSGSMDDLVSYDQETSRYVLTLSREHDTLRDALAKIDGVAGVEEVEGELSLRVTFDASRTSPNQILEVPEKGAKTR